MILFASAFALGLSLLSGAALAQQLQWLESTAPHYTVFYQSGFEADVAFVRLWLDATEQMMKEKYGSTSDGYHVSVYLLPEPTGEINAVESGALVCCNAPTGGVRSGRIRMLTRSASIWNEGGHISSLGLPKGGDDYQAKVIVSEYIPIGHYAAQDGRASGGWRYYDAPDWFVQGLQEYDAIFHSTENNRSTTRERLNQWARANASNFSCCSSGLALKDVYNGGAIFMVFLADRFGEAVHARILRSSEATFEAALKSETRMEFPQLFVQFRAWLESR